MKLDMDEYKMIDKKEYKAKGEFVNRELSWLDFNIRVLECADFKDNPLNERLNFLGITGSNLEEFISVRFANAYNNKDSEPYSEILKEIKHFKELQHKSYTKLKEKIDKNYGYKFIKPEDLNKKGRCKLLKIFNNNIFPLLTPIDINTNNINILNYTTYVGVVIKSRNKERLTIIPIFKSIEPWVIIEENIMMVEDVISYYLRSHIFINQEIEATGIFRVVKDASVILSHDESKFIVDRMEETLDRREHSNPLYLDITKDSDELLVRYLTSFLKIPPGHIYKKSRIVNYRIFSQLKLFGKKESYKPFTPFEYENYENYYNLFQALRHEDILLHHPYDSYNTVIKFIEHAASDHKVRAIRQTLYRVSGIDSPIVNALCKAARNGINVTVLVEIKARFDEDNNLRLIEKLQRAGVVVVYGSEFLKTHCKMCIVSRAEKGKIKNYCHVATGNYNEKTARLYTDISYLTSRKKIGKDLGLIFNIISGHSRPDKRLDRIYYSPVNLRKQLEKCIDREIRNVKKGKKGAIFIKVNSISDTRMVNKLYEAAKSGVKIYIICRGVCSITPTKNIFIKSIVGRFLEHSRIYYFYNSKDEEYYISSADLLTRNLDRRVETLIRLKDKNIISQMQWIVDIMKLDTANSYIQSKPRKWERINGDFDCHKWLIKNSDTKKWNKKWNKKLNRKL